MDEVDGTETVTPVFCSIATHTPNSINWQVFPSVPADDVLEQAYKPCLLLWLQMAEEFAIIFVGKLAQDAFGEFLPIFQRRCVRNPDSRERPDETKRERKGRTRASASFTRTLAENANCAWTKCHVIVCCAVTPPLSFRFDGIRGSH